MIDAAAVQRGLRGWPGAALRNLPWRHTRDPWAIIVSETMLQQTQVGRVVDRYHSFLRRFPTTAACARAPVGDVIDEWVGLGYNRRAVQLHRLAVQVEERFGGRVPDDLALLLSLPGIGSYTARAVLAFAFERDVAVLDTNVGRVLARLWGSRLGPASAQAQADALVPGGEGWWWNQVMLDFGATVCVAAAPRCAQCPLLDACAWRGRGDDPARGSAAVSKGQSKFAGSDREGRGRLVAALKVGPVDLDDAAAVAGWDDRDRAARAVDSLVRDGLAVVDGAVIRLP